jgi:hypothetical protein
LGKLSTNRRVAQESTSRTKPNPPPDHERLGDIASTLQIYSLTLGAVEAARIETQERLRQLIEDKELPSDSFFLDPLKIALETLVTLEKQEARALIATLRHHPLHAWVKDTIGVGERQAARLIAELGGNPAFNFAENRLRRGPAELWAYAGYNVIDGQAAVRRRGQRLGWNPEVKRRVHLIAVSCVRHSHSPYRRVYDQAREKLESTTHTAACKRCKAQPGSELHRGHKHARALRAVAKAVLRDLFLHSKVLLGS